MWKLIHSLYFLFLSFYYMLLLILLGERERINQLNNWKKRSRHKGDQIFMFISNNLCSASSIISFVKMIVVEVVYCIKSSLSLNITIYYWCLFIIIIIYYFRKIYFNFKRERKEERNCVYAYIKYFYNFYCFILK